MWPDADLTGLPRAVQFRDFGSRAPRANSRACRSTRHCSSCTPPHDRRPEVHRARRRRHAAAAAQGAPAALRPAARRQAVLLHDLRMDDVELVASGLATAAPSCCTRARHSRPTATCCGAWPSASASRTRDQPEVPLGAAEGRRCPAASSTRRAAHAHVTGSRWRRAVRLRVRRNQADLHLASIRAHRHHSCFCLGNPWLPVPRARSSRPARMATQVYDDEVARCSSSRASSCARALPVMPIASGTTRRIEVPGRVLRALPGRVVPRRLCRANCARRVRHPRPLGRGAQPGRRAHWHAEIYRQVEKLEEILETSRSGRTGTTTCAWCCSCACGPESRSTPRSRSASATRSAPTPRRGMCRRASCGAGYPAHHQRKIVELAVRNVITGDQCATPTRSPTRRHSTTSATGRARELRLHCAP